MSILAAALLALAALPSRAVDFDGQGLRLPRSLQADVTLENGELRRGFATYKGWELEAGDLGTGAAPLLGQSRYFGLGLRSSGESTFMDFKYDWNTYHRASVVDLNARLFPSVPAPDPLVRERPGMDPAAYSQQQLYFLSTLRHYGRAYNAYGPVDLAWSALGVARLNHMFPQVAVDPTLSARLRHNGGHSVGVFAGVTGTVAVMSENWAQSLVLGEKASDVRMVTAPHAEIGAWGTAGRLAYQTFAGMQKNPSTTVTNVSGSIMGAVSPGVLSVGLKSETEKGFGGEFSRKENSLQTSLAQRNGLEWRVSAGKRDFGFGGAAFSDNFVQLGVVFHDSAGRSFGAHSVTSSGGMSDAAPAWAGRVQANLREGVTALDGMLAGVSTLLDQAGPLLAAADAGAVAAFLSDAYANLAPELRAAIQAEVGVPDFNRLAQTLVSSGPGAAAEAVAELERQRAALESLKTALSDPGRLERIVTRYMRVALYEAIVDTNVKLWGKDTPLTPALLLAALNAYGQGPAALAPVPPGAFEAVIDERIRKKLRETYGVDCAPAQIVDCALAGLPPELRARLQGLPADKARAALADIVGLAGATLRLEANQFLLGLMVSARQLDILDVTRGESMAALSRGFAMQSYQRLDQRMRLEAGARRTASLPLAPVADLAAKRAAAEAELAAQKRAEKLDAIGARLGGEMREAGVELDPFELARLVAAGYLEDSLLAFAVEAKALLAERGRRMLLQYGESVRLENWSAKGLTVVTLPPTEGRDPGVMLDAVLMTLRGGR